MKGGKFFVGFVVGLFGCLLGITHSSLAQSSGDSLQFKMDNVLLDRVHSIDSTQHRLTYKIDSISNHPQKFTHLTDSLKPNLSQYNQKLDLLKGKFTHRIDSLNKLGQPTGHYTHLLDSIQHAGPLKDVKQAEAQLNSLEQQVKKPLDNVNSAIKNAETKINEKINLPNKESTGSVIPGVNLPGQTGIPNLQTSGLSSTLPGANINLPTGSVPGINNPLGGVNTPNINLPTNQLNNITNVPQQELTQLTTNGDLGKIEDQMGKVNDYSKDIKNITTGDVDKAKALPKELESHAIGSANMGELDQFKSVTKSLKDEESAKKLLAQKAKEQAIDHFAGKDAELKTAMSKVSKLKMKYSTVTSLKDIPKGMYNSMKGKPLIERIVPGLTWQLQMKGIALLDLNPNVGYRLSGKFTIGGGWNERIGITHGTITHNQRIYGPRTFLDFKFAKDYSIRTEVEKMNTTIPSFGYSAGSTEGTRHWVWGWFLGIKRDYKFSKHVRGNVQMSYNFLDKVYKTNPYADRFNVRMGFELGLR